jgi:tetratricopeptide (TPR) repeat protein
VITDLKKIFVLDSFRSKLILIICCIVCYANVVHDEYSLDDDFAFYSNKYVQEGIKGIPDILTHPYFNDGKLSFDYRPVASITFAIEKEFFGNDPHVSHVDNLIFYIIAVLLVLSLMTEVFALDIVPAFLIALFFAVHPAHTEVVISIKNREEILSFIFCLLSFFAANSFFLKSSTSDKIKYGVLTLACLLLSFASKLTSIPMVGILAALFYFKGWHRSPKLFYSIIGLIAVMSAVYMMVILQLAHRPVYDLENPLVKYNDISSKIGTTAASLLFYFRFMWVPYPFSFFYGYNTIPVVQIGDPVAVASIFLHLGIFIAGVVLFFKKDITGFFILAYFISISIYSNIVMLYTGIVSERALFFPGLWFIAAICNFIYSRVSAAKAANSALKVALMGLASALITAYGVLDINRVPQWHDQITLMSTDVKHLDNSTLSNYFYACVLKNKTEEIADTALQNKYLSESKKYFYHVCDISPTYPYGYFRLGLIYRYDRYVPDSAYYYFKKAYTLNADLTDVAYQYGRLEYEVGDKKLSCDIYTKLYQEIPFDTFTVFYHALLLLKTGHTAEGHEVNKVFMNMAPGYYQSHFNEGLYYELVGDSANAASYYETAVRLGCIDQTVYRFLADYYQKQGRTADANKYLRLLQ